MNRRRWSTPTVDGRTNVEILVQFESEILQLVDDIDGVAEVVPALNLHLPRFGHSTLAPERCESCLPCNR